MNRFISKIIRIILFGIIPISIQAQNMVWTAVSLTDQQEKYKFSASIEERVYVPLKQKDFMIDYKATSTIWKIMPLAGLSVWNREEGSEIRPYYGLDSKYFRVILEHRLYLYKEPATRLRVRISYKQKLTNWLSLITSEELFWGREFDHNRLILGTQFKLKNIDIDTGWMSYYKDKNQNTLIIKLNCELPRSKLTRHQN